MRNVAVQECLAKAPQSSPQPGWCCRVSQAMRLKMQSQSPHWLHYRFYFSVPEDHPHHGPVKAGGWLDHHQGGSPPLIRVCDLHLTVGLMPSQHLQVWGHCALPKPMCTGSLCHTGSWTFLQVSPKGAVSVTSINGWQETNTRGLSGCAQLEYSFALSFPAMLSYGHSKNPSAVPGHFLHFQALQGCRIIMILETFMSRFDRALSNLTWLKMFLPNAGGLD